MRDENSQITFADLEFLQQGIRLDPLLEKISDFLDNHDELVELVRCDLERGLKEPETGRPGLTPDQVLRSLILMRIKNWDYRELRERVNDGWIHVAEVHRLLQPAGSPAQCLQPGVQPADFHHRGEAQ